MPRSLFLFSLLFAGAGLTLLEFNGCGNIPLSSPIQHVVIIVQENRTPDNLFHDPALIAAGADIASSGLNSQGMNIPITSATLSNGYDLDHSHKAFEQIYDSGKMDGANQTSTGCSSKIQNCTNPQYRYVQASDVAPYFKMAEEYVFGDRMFQTNQGPSFPAHQFLLSGTSAPTATSNMFAAENPIGSAGCTSPPATSVALINPEGIESEFVYPCFEHPALTDELNARGISWRYYTPNERSIWTAPDAIQHICGPNVAPPNATNCLGSDWINHVVIYSTQNEAPILTDIAQKKLQAVSWVIPSGQNSDHPAIGTNLGGPSWVTSIVNAIGESSYWRNTAIIITWDDWGGWYDHVRPPKVILSGSSWGSGYVYGFRVPLIIVSPYAKARYISHVTHDFGSILGFVEHVFGLSSLGYADAYADDLSDCFDFNQPPLVFQNIPAPHSPDYFLNDHSPITDPDND